MSLLREWGELGPIYGKQWRNWDVQVLNGSGPYL